MLKFSTPNGFAYDAAGNLLSAGGLWSGDTVSYSYANRLRSGLSVGSWQQSYGYDAALRLTNLLSMAGSFGYAYDPVRLYRVDKLALPNSAYIAYHYDPLTRLLGTDLTRGTDNHVLDGYTYRYDLLGQRTGISRNNGFSSSTVSAGYDAIGELTSWSATEPDNAARFNEQLIYAYDAAGNLQQRWNHQFMQSFTVDAANELTNVTRSGILTVNGNTPTPASSVTINGQPAVTYGDFTFASSSGFALADGLNAFTNIAGNYSATVMVTNTLSVNLPASVNLQFDANGNLTNDGTRVFGYDAENQLTNVTVTGQWREDFLYDGLNRRRITRQYGWTGNAWALTNETRFVYDGKAVIQEWDSNNVAQVSYTRGRDASGSRQGAGGIGGLLARTDATGSTYYHADGNGNITALMDGNQYIVARYLYDPFGRMLGKWGTLADANVYRFSSKEWDGSAGLYDYLYRFYDPNLQRWLSRDPIGELGGINLYGFVGNNPIDFMDPYGLAWFDDLANWAQTQNAQFKDGMNATAGNENSWVTAGALDTVSDFAAGLLSYPQAISQLGAAEGNFSVDPSLNNLAAVANDVAIAADVIAAGAAPLPGLRGKKTCPAGGPCFAAGTKVSTPSGETNIEDIKIGDMVYAYDFDNGNVVERQVTDISRNETCCWVYIKTDDEVIKATRTHPFWVENENEWVEADELEKGMSVQSEDGQIKLISSVNLREVEKPEATYNLVVDREHNYFVGASHVLVHNGTPLDASGYWNYHLEDANGNTYYHGMAGPDATEADVAYRHGNTGNRFDPANGDTLVREPGTRTYGEARRMENENALRDGTILPDRGGVNTGNYRGNRQRPIGPKNRQKYYGPKC